MKLKEDKTKAAPSRARGGFLVLSNYRRRRFAAFFFRLGAARRLVAFLAFRFFGAALRLADLRARFFAGMNLVMRDYGLMQTNVCMFCD